MNWKNRPLIATVAFALLLVPAAAAWSNTNGGHEPNTEYDDASVMYQDAPSTPGKRVYFNAYTVTSSPVNVGVNLNPNSPYLESRNEAPVLEYHEALLGVWTDCNGDGYVGMAEGALREYDSALLLGDDTLCPAASGDPAANWSGDHNYNGLVTEYVPILRTANANDTRRFVVNETRVWGDWHRPDEVPFLRSCALAPQPRGTYQSTGGFINYFDCRAAVLETFNGAVDPLGDPLGLRFEDADDARTGSLGQIQTFGTEDESRSPVRVWDCSADPAFRSGDTLNETQPGTWEELRPFAGNGTTNNVHNIEVYALASDPVGDTQDPTIPALVNHTFEGADGDCDFENDAGHDFYGNWATFYVGEEDFLGVNPKNKTQSNWNFGPVGGENTQNRGRPFACVNRNEGLGIERTCSPTLVGPEGSAGRNDGDYGINDPGAGGGRWASSSIWASKPGPQMVRANAESGMPEPAGAYWLTFYAYIGPNATAQGLETPGTGGTYGSFHCGLNTGGIHNGWNCDRDAWYINPDGSAMPEGGVTLSRPGMPWTLRDVDCYDGGNNQGIPTGLPAYGSDPCQ